MVKKGMPYFHIGFHLLGYKNEKWIILHHRGNERRERCGRQGRPDRIPQEAQTGHSDRASLSVQVSLPQEWLQEECAIRFLSPSRIWMPPLRRQTPSRAHRDSRYQDAQHHTGCLWLVGVNCATYVIVEKESRLKTDSMRSKKTVAEFLGLKMYMYSMRPKKLSIS